MAEAELLSDHESDEWTAKNAEDCTDMLGRLLGKLPATSHGQKSGEPIKRSKILTASTDIGFRGFETSSIIM